MIGADDDLELLEAFIMAIAASIVIVPTPPAVAQAAALDL
jgi:hypothetical protein